MSRSLAANVLERDRSAQVGLALDVVLDELEVKRAQERGGLAEDRHDAGVRAQLRDARGGGVRAQI